MPKCKKCGKVISEHQDITLKGMCPSCSLLKHINRSVGGIVFLATGGIILTFLIYYGVRFLFF
jgi:hypothetical protein